MPLEPLSYYDLLGVEEDVTLEDLKRAYRRRARELHPDRGGDPEEFKRMKEAYDVLYDPRKRKIYDQYGAEAVKMMDGVGNVTPEAVSAMLKSIGIGPRLLALFLVTIVIGIMLSPTILVSLRWNQSINCAWTLAFIPAWVICGLVFVSCCFCGPPTPDADEELDDDTRGALKAARVVQISTMLQMLCFSAFLALLALKLDSVLPPSLSYLLAFLPLYLLLALKLMGSAVKYNIVSTVMRRAEAEAAARGGDSDDFGSKQLFWSFVYGDLLPLALALTMAFLVAAMLDGALPGATWWTVATPFWVWLALAVLRQCSSCLSTMATPTEARQDGGMFAVCLSCTGLIILTTSVCLALAKLSATASVSAFVVFIPVFIVGGCMFCLCCCLLMCSGAGDDGAGRSSYGGGSSEGAGSAYYQHQDENDLRANLTGNGASSDRNVNTQDIEYGSAAAGTPITSAAAGGDGGGMMGID